MPEPMEKGMKIPEFAPQPERSREGERAPQSRHDVSDTQDGPSEPATSSAPVEPEEAAPSAAADPTAASIETILSEDIFEHYRTMPPDAQLKFRKKGEDAVSELTAMMQGTVIKAKTVLLIIVGWLKLIPGVNKYFLEQESKIKTDKIIELHKRMHGG
jgi:hypothetical protein